MTSPAAVDRTSLGRRLERYRAATQGGLGPAEATRQVELPHAPIHRGVLAERLARTVGGEVIALAGGSVVRCESAPREIPLDRIRLAALPGQPPPGVPLVCLDTETTGLATATGTVAFLIGLGWWEGERFHQVQLLLPDHADEPALLAALAAYIPLDGWLVTYNGRGFDWPLLVTRYRMARRAAPVHGGHLDLLPVVRRLFRHRLDDARLQTVEVGLLGMARHGDIDGSEIPARYLGFVRGGPATPLVGVVRHNDQDVRSLARLLVLLADGYGTAEARRTAPAGDLGGLARAYTRAGQLHEALECYDAAFVADPQAARAAEPAQREPAGERVPRDLVREPVPPDIAGEPEPRELVREPVVFDTWPRGMIRPGKRTAEPTGPGYGALSHVATRGSVGEVPWWSPQVPADFGGTRRPALVGIGPSVRSAAFATPWTTDRIAVERAHLLRRLRRWDEAADAWASLAAGPGRTAIVAAIELAKLREHRLSDAPGALRATGDGLALAERRQRLGRPEPRLEADLRARARRLRRRLVARGALDVMAGRAPPPR